MRIREMEERDNKTIEQIIKRSLESFYRKLGFQELERALDENKVPVIVECYKFRLVPVIVECYKFRLVPGTFFIASIF
ncbi:hypothetical protein SAMN05443253_11623 [Bacillus sp. OK048]|nr:hypothetical protein SAMN05443253_11623 [Bacillus sp. OK048]